MGYRKVPTIHTIDFEEKYPGLIVRMRGIRIGKLRRIIGALNEDELSPEKIGEVIDIIGQHLVSWTLEDESGTPLPATPEELEDLELDMLLDIVERWTNKLTDVSPDLGKDSPSSGQFPGQPVTMEAL